MWRLVGSALQLRLALEEKPVAVTSRQSSYTFVYVSMGMLLVMLSLNTEVCTEDLTSTKVSAFHLHPVFCVGLAAWLEEAGVCQFCVKASAIELLDSSEDELLLMDIKSIQELDPCSFKRFEQGCAQRTIVVTTCEQLDRFGAGIPKNIGGLVSPRGVMQEFISAMVAH